MVFGGLNFTRNPSCSSTLGTSSGTRPSAALSWFPVSAATRWVLSGIDLMTTCLRWGPPYPWLAERLLPHQSSLASTRIWEFLSHSTNLYGPDPTGSCQKLPTFFFMALGEAIAKGDIVRFLTNGPCGFLRENRIVYSSTTSTLSMTESPSNPPNWAA